MNGIIGHAGINDPEAIAWWLILVALWVALLLSPLIFYMVYLLVVTARRTRARLRDRKLAQRGFEVQTREDEYEDGGRIKRGGS